ncbi:unnamed protein product [Mytilus edulis]|uniref:Death domain-containing protein n=1 Tax=Mytilus edulis TaxID=6550 RepID=A0A8S3SM34_MYTED|nr:unnamed protein product [Mytilus edulis]
MFDGRKGLYTELEEYPEGDVTAASILVHWVTSVLTYCNKSDDKMPRILFAATHGDRFSKNIYSDFIFINAIPVCIIDRRRKKKLAVTFQEELTKEFSSHKLHEHILYEKVFFINATDAEDLDIDCLKDTLVDIAFQQSTWGQQMPIVWVPLVLQIADLKGDGNQKATLERKTVTDSFMIPCIVKSTIPRKLWNAATHNRTICIAYHLKEAVVPSALSFKLIGAAISIWPLKVVDSRSCLYIQAAIMDANNSNQLQIHVQGQSIVAYLVNDVSKHFISPDLATTTQECLTLTVGRILQFYRRYFGKQSNQFATDLFEIEVGEVCKSGKCLIPLSNAKKLKFWICKHGIRHETKCLLNWVFDKLMGLFEWRDTTESDQSPATFEKLLKALKAIERQHYLCQVHREDHGLIEKADRRLQDLPSDNLLNTLENLIGDCIVHLGIELGISIVDIRKTMYKFPRDLDGQIHDLLIKWKSNDRVKPTIFWLMVALKRVKAATALNFLKKMYGVE